MSLKQGQQYFDVNKDCQGCLSIPSQNFFNIQSVGCRLSRAWLSQNYTFCGTKPPPYAAVGNRMWTSPGPKLKPNSSGSMHKIRDWKCEKGFELRLLKRGYANKKQKQRLGPMCRSQYHYFKFFVSILLNFIKFLIVFCRMKIERKAKTKERICMSKRGREKRSSSWWPPGGGLWRSWAGSHFPQTPRPVVAHSGTP